MTAGYPGLPVYLQADGSILRAGFTTGTCAAAAARAATELLFGGGQKTEVQVATPSGLTLTLPLCQAETDGVVARCAVRKWAGDDPDVTGGLVVVAEVRVADLPGVFLAAGAGVGRVTKPGLAVPPGEAAINPVPRRQIVQAVAEVLPVGRGVAITLSIPGGEEAACKTLNPQLGIVGGLSILGTTGIVEPMSADAFRRSLPPQVDVALAAGHHRLFLVPGRMGKKNLLGRFSVAEEAVVLTGNFIGFMLKACAARGVEEAVLFGHAGKLVKVAAGVTDTHSSVADARRETLVAYAALCGVPPGVLHELMGHGTAEESVHCLLAGGYGGVLAAVAREAARRGSLMAGGNLRVGCVMTNLKGEIVGCDDVGAAALEACGNG